MFQLFLPFVSFYSDEFGSLKVKADFHSYSEIELFLKLIRVYLGLHRLITRFSLLFQGFFFKYFGITIYHYNNV